MLNRLTVSAILKSIVGIAAIAVIIVLGHETHQAWTRLQTATRLNAVAEASAHLFTSLHHLRLDRSRSVRALNMDVVATALDTTMVESRAAELPALKASVAALAAIDFPERAAIVADIEQRLQKLAALHSESVQALIRPKAERRAGLAQGFDREASGFISALDKTSSRLAQLVKLDDALFDQLLAIKQTTWVARNYA